MIQAFDQPLLVIALDEGANDRTCLVERLEAVQPDALFLERAHEALDHAVALRFADKRWTVRDAQPAQLGAKRIRHVLRAPVAANRQAPRHLFAECSEGHAHALMNRLQRRPAVADLRAMPADDVVTRVVDRPEEPAPAVSLGVEPRG